MEGKLCNQFVSILIDPGSNYNYVFLKLVEKFTLAKELHTQPWMVKLAMRKKIKMSQWVRLCVLSFKACQ